MSLYIITGGPGSGKTSLIQSLESKGYRIFPEASRMVISEQQEQPAGTLPWTDLHGFQHLVFERQKRDYHAAKELQDIVFLDRGLPDGLGYMKSGGLLIPQELKEDIVQFPYADTVFLTPPWKEIYKNDSARWEDFEKAQDIFFSLKEVYEELGYTTATLPFDSIEKRIDFILNCISTGKKGS
ncbi:MAG: AAA family ATPase [Flavobacteriales bacterium]